MKPSLIKIYSSLEVGYEAHGQQWETRSLCLVPAATRIFYGMAEIKKKLYKFIYYTINLLHRVAWNDFAPRFSMKENGVDPDTTEGYILQTFLGTLCIFSLIC